VDIGYKLRTQVRIPFVVGLNEPQCGRRDIRFQDADASDQALLTYASASVLNQDRVSSADTRGRRKKWCDKDAVALQTPHLDVGNLSGSREVYITIDSLNILEYKNWITADSELRSLGGRRLILPFRRDFPNLCSIAILTPQL